MKGLFIGLITTDIQMAAGNYPEENKKARATGLNISSGGPATNAAVLFSHLGGKSILVTSIGNHQFTKMILQEMKDFDIDVYDILAERPANPVVSSIITSKRSGTRTIMSYLPEIKYVESHLSRQFRFNDISVILADGFYTDLSLELFSHGMVNKCPVVLDGGSWKSTTKKLLKYVDYVLCSEDFFPPGCNTSIDVLNYLQDAGIYYAAITRGEKPVIVYENGKHNEIPVKKVEAIDTLAAGDFFHGAFCYYLVNGHNFTSAIIKSVKIASESCKYFGTRNWLKKG